jgi:hypothetical protein
VVKTGKTPALDAAGWRRLIGSIPTAALRDLRDWAPIATLRNPFAHHRGADLGDRGPKGTGSEIRLHEKGRTHHVMPCHYADEPGTRPMPGG